MLRVLKINVVKFGHLLLFVGSYKSYSDSRIDIRELLDHTVMLKLSLTLNNTLKIRPER
jgi:hypothetical protein